jgi:hypothetical protein
MGNAVLSNKIEFATQLFPQESRGRITLPNGWEISVVWGGGTYSTNYDAPIGKPIQFSQNFEFEVACFNPEGELVYSNGDVYSHVSSEWIKDVLIPHVSKMGPDDKNLPDQS